MYVFVRPLFSSWSKSNAQDKIENPNIVATYEIIWNVLPSPMEFTRWILSFALFARRVNGNLAFVLDFSLNTPLIWVFGKLMPYCCSVTNILTAQYFPIAYGQCKNVIQMKTRHINFISFVKNNCYRCWIPWKNANLSILQLWNL